MFWVYVIKNSFPGRIYTGYTQAIWKKELQRSSFTYKNKAGGEWRLIYKKYCNTRKEAIEYEKELKSSSGRKFIKSSIN